MSGRIVQLEPDPHRAVQALLPWYANGTLAADEQARVQQHLAGCALCSAELAFEQTLREVADGPAVVAARDVEHAWAQLRDRLPARTGEARAARGASSLLAGWRDSAGWLRGLALAQAFALALVAALALPHAGTPTPDGRYRALGDAPAPAPENVIVRFRPDASEAALRTALRDSGAQLAGGPTATDAYLLAVPAAHEAQALQRLRAQPAVVLAESLDGGAAR
jgi:hypothetical protein